MENPQNYLYKIRLLTTFTKANTQSYHNINGKHMTKELHCYNLNVPTIFKLGFNKNTTTFSHFATPSIFHYWILIFKPYNLLHRYVLPQTAYPFNWTALQIFVCLLALYFSFV